MQKDILLEKKKNAPSGLKIFSFCLALLPILALITIIVVLVINSVPAIKLAGWNLFSASYHPDRGSYGLFPAIWGTFLVVIVTMLIAVPVSLFMAILANDFSFGFVNTIVRWILGVFSGIPPIIFAVMTPIFFNIFIWPKFAGQGLAESALLKMVNNYDILPLYGSVLLGGILLSFLVIPFMAPLIDDVIHSIPHSLKEASLALGANRWHTLTHVTLPSSLAGLVNVIMLGILTAVGEAIIVSFAIGFGPTNLPSPLFDILERIAPLTSTIAGLSANGLVRFESGSPLPHAVSSFAALLLILIAFILLGAAAYLQKKFKKRFNP
jgi:phosphate transport system permease protein